MKRPLLLYLQLPLLDNDATGARENFPFGGAYLDHALRCDTESTFWQTRFAPTRWDELDTPHVTDAILRSDVAVLAVTLYLWNIERTLDLAARLKRARPNLRIMAGGPEVAHDHPLLRNAPFDAIVHGEGEGVFAPILAAWRQGVEPDFQNTAIRTPDGFRFGRTAPPPVDLTAAQPDETALMACIQNRPVVFVETVRGCPLSCAYCRYYQLHAGLRTLPIDQVVERIRRFRALGATEIRFVDPTFNARAHFDQLLEALVELNRDRRLRFFAELRGDTLTDRQARLMAEANFSEVEIGVQSIDPRVLANIQRPCRLEPLAQGIRSLCDAGVRTTLDVMYALPEQSLAEVKASLDWCLAFGDKVQVQCMQTLLLPGTTLRREAARWNLESEALPPYGITRTPALTPADLRAMECLLDEHPRLPADPATPRFCGQRLAGLFRERHRLHIDHLDQPIPGRGNRRCLALAGDDLCAHRHALGRLIERAVASDPFVLWQFVLEPQREEPLDLLEPLINILRRQPAQLLDRFASAAAFDRLVSRRLFVRAPANTSRAWRNAVESLLRDTFG